MYDRVYHILMRKTDGILELVTKNYLKKKKSLTATFPSVT